MNELKEKLLARIKVEEETGCWIWQGARTNKGYGQIRNKHLVLRTHRVAYELFVGEIPETKSIDHLCKNRSCCNPAHLEPVTNQENVHRGSAVKITVALARKIRQLYKSGITQTELAKRFGVSQSNISLIVRNEAWVETAA